MDIEKMSKYARKVALRQMQREGQAVSPVAPVAPSPESAADAEADAVAVKVMVAVSRQINKDQRIQCQREKLAWYEQEHKRLKALAEPNGQMIKHLNEVIHNLKMRVEGYEHKISNQRNAIGDMFKTIDELRAEIRQLKGETNGEKQTAETL